MTHEKNISILLDMANKGELNEKIIRDIDNVMAVRNGGKEVALS